MPWRGPSSQLCASLGICAAADAPTAGLLKPKAPPAIGSAPNGAREGALAGAAGLIPAGFWAAPPRALATRASFSSGLGTRAPGSRLRPGVGVIAGKPIAVYACFLGLRAAPVPQPARLATAASFEAGVRSRRLCGRRRLPAAAGVCCGSGPAGCARAWSASAALGSGAGAPAGC